uniref:SH3 domain-containing protein n=1 Tax=Steinernema glaseri TaxID=37863 RepID=A0A1I7YV53_9BILA
MSGVRHAARQHSVPYEGSSNWRYPSGSGGGYYYSSRAGAGAGNSATPSPSSNVSYRSSSHHAASSIGPQGMDSSNTMASHRRAARADHQEAPTYHVEHLATFAVGREFGLQYPQDGVRKLKQMEKNSAIWAQPMLLRLKPQMISVEDDNGDPVEQFPMDLVRDPTAHISDDPQDVYNNILLFVVREDHRGAHRQPPNPTEMHIFQCLRVSAREVVEDIEHYVHGEYTKVRPGRRDYSERAASHFSNGPQYYAPAAAQQPMNGFHQQRGSYDVASAAPAPVPAPAQFRDNASASSDTSEYFERDVNTLNRCFDDIERFVARIQSAAIAQRELEAQAHRFRTQHRNKQKQQQQEMQHGILQLRAQLPQSTEFHEILQKFKLSFNLLAKLKNHIHEPNAPELLHFLFTPLTVILDACHWGLGRNIADQVVSPLITLEARELMQNCLNSKESDVWMSLGNAWRIPPEDWIGPLPPPYRPVFVDGFAPYGNPNVNEIPMMKQGAGRRHPSRTDSEPPPLNAYAPQAPQRAARSQSLQPSMFELDRILHEEQHKLQMEKDRIREQERMLHEERARLEEEKNRLMASRQTYSSTPHLPSSDRPARYTDPVSPVSQQQQQVDSPRAQSYLDRLRERRAKVVQATYDRTAQNPKELTVSRGEYLEVLNDTKNWWECRNIHNRTGFVPHTILSLLPTPKDLPPQQNDIVVNPPQHIPGSSISPRPERVLPPHQPYRQAQHNPLDDVDVASIVPIANHIREEEVNENIVLKKPPPQKISPKAAPLEKLLLEEFVSTLKRNGPKPKPKASPKSKIQLTQDSPKEVVQEWLKEKEFSPQLQKLFSEMNGQNLFLFEKKKLVEHCGEEGARLYSLLLVQKKNCHYNTGKPAELQAILKQRKLKVDAQNEAPNEEPEQEAPSLATPDSEEAPVSP